MRRTILLIICCFTLSLSAFADDEKPTSQLKKFGEAIGDFEITPTAPNTYWEDVDGNFDYKVYEIKITSEPVSAKISWNRKQVGATPFTYKFSGLLDDSDSIMVKATPFDKRYAPKTTFFRGDSPLPRKIHFDLETR